jgi:hypothetical protein
MHLVPLGAEAPNLSGHAPAMQVFRPAIMLTLHARGV